MALRNAINAAPAGAEDLHGGARDGTTAVMHPTTGYRSDLAGDPGPTEASHQHEDAAKAVRPHYKPR